MEPLRVLHLINDFRPDGGAENALTHLANHLDRGQVDLWVGSLFRRGGLKPRLNLPPERILCFNFAHFFYGDALALGRLVGFLRKKQIQIVHTHLFEANTVGRIAGWLARTPVLVTTEHNIYANKSFHCVLLDRLLAGVTDQLVAVSEAVRAFAAEQARIDPRHFLVIPNGLALGQIPQLSAADRNQKRASLGIAPERPVIISVGRLTEQKGYPVLIHAAKMVLSQFSDALFLIVGTGPLEANLQRQVTQAHLANAVRFLGVRSDVLELLQASTLLALPSYWEGLPVVLLEAGACRLPAVATRVGGVAEIIEHERTGLLVPPRDPQALAGAICQLLGSPETRQRMGERAQELVEQRFSAAEVAAQIQALYGRLLRSRQATQEADTVQVHDRTFRP